MLVAHDWDLEKAHEALRKKGLAAAAKKASRHAAEGLVGCSMSGGAAVVVELNSETDFVARNDMFQQLLRNVLGAAHGVGAAAGQGAAQAGGGPAAGSSDGEQHEMDMEKLLHAPTSSGTSVSDAVTAVAATVRENVRLRRAYRVAPGPGELVGTYVHQEAAPGLGKLAAVVVLAAEGGQLPADKLPALQEAGDQLAMHVAGMRPAYLARGAVPEHVLERERHVLTEQLTADPGLAGKPAAVLGKVVEGRLGKVLGEWCLLEQRFVLEDSVTVEQMLKRLSKDVGGRVRVSRFLRVQCGEGLEGGKGTSDFAAEVARIVSDTS